MGLSAVEEARSVNQKAGELKIKVETLQKRLEEVLQGHDFNGLEAEMKQAGKKNLPVTWW